MTLSFLSPPLFPRAKCVPHPKRPETAVLGPGCAKVSNRKVGVFGREDTWPERHDPSIGCRDAFGCRLRVAVRFGADGRHAPDHRVGTAGGDEGVRHHLKSLQRTQETCFFHEPDVGHAAQLLGFTYDRPVSLMCPILTGRIMEDNAQSCRKHGYVGAAWGGPRDLKKASEHVSTARNIDLKVTDRL
jgi:hypothetical protein